jgi:hypothetical protein
MGSTAIKRRLKKSQAEDELRTDLPRQLLSTQVTSNHVGEEDPFVCTSGEKVGLTPHSEIQQVLVTSVTVAATSPSSLEEARPPLKKVRTKNYLTSSAQYVYVGCLNFSGLWVAGSVCWGL